MEQQKLQIFRIAGAENNLVALMAKQPGLHSLTYIHTYSHTLKTWSWTVFNNVFCRYTAQTLLIFWHLVSSAWAVPGHTTEQEQGQGTVSTGWLLSTAHTQDKPRQTQAQGSNYCWIMIYKDGIRKVQNLESPDPSELPMYFKFNFYYWHLTESLKAPGYLNNQHVKSINES